MPVFKQVIQEGDEQTFPRVGDLIKIVYQGWLYEPATDGRGRSLSGGDRPGQCTIEIGRGILINGLEQQILNMSKGQKANFRISSDLAYGEEGFPNLVPPGATVIFEIQLLGVRV